VKDARRLLRSSKGREIPDRRDAIREQYWRIQDRAFARKDRREETGETNADTQYRNHHLQARTDLPTSTLSIQSPTMDDTPDVATLVTGLVSSSESARKYAVFKLQGLLADPSFADAFIQGDGLPALHSCVLEATGNAQAYALGGLLVLLELDVGWEVVDAEVVEKVSYGQDTRTLRARSREEEHALTIPHHRP